MFLSILLFGTAMGKNVYGKAGKESIGFATQCVNQRRIIRLPLYDHICLAYLQDVCTVPGSNPGGDKRLSLLFFVKFTHGAHPASRTMRIGALSRGKAAGARR